MIAEHTLTIVAACPVNDGRDVYEATFRLNRLVKVEDLQVLVEDYNGTRIFQEELTQELADHMRCEVETRGMHGNVRSRVVCKPKRGRRK